MDLGFGDLRKAITMKDNGITIGNKGMGFSSTEIVFIEDHLRIF